MQMYKDPTNIYPPLTRDSFFKKLLVLRKSIEKKKEVKKIQMWPTLFCKNWNIFALKVMINQRQWKERFEKVLDNIPNGGLNLIHNSILKYVYSEFEKQMPECKRSHSIHRQWFIAFQLFLKLIYLRRELILEKWIANEFPEFEFQTLRGNNNIQEQKVGNNCTNKVVKLSIIVCDRVNVIKCVVAVKKAKMKQDKSPCRVDCDQVIKRFMIV
ncbi:hypothetical protein RFI_29434, partial [Reticulomyxa filosa]